MQRYEVIAYSPGIWHVVPLDDLLVHTTSPPDCECICGATTLPVDFDDGDIVVMVRHHPLDGREHSERTHDREHCPVCQLNAPV